MRSLHFSFLERWSLVGADYIGELVEVGGDSLSVNLLKNELLYVGEGGGKIN